MYLAAAGNTEVPAYLVLAAKGYDVSLMNDGGACSARKDQHCFVADSPPQLLGLVSMAEHRGENWRASDQDIHSFLEKFPGS